MSIQSKIVVQDQQQKSCDLHCCFFLFHIYDFKFRSDNDKGLTVNINNKTDRLSP